MDREDMYEVIRAIAVANDSYDLDTTRGGEPDYRRSENRQWDKVICVVCTGCAKPLGQYENREGLAFCYECRDVLFPELGSLKESWRKRHYLWRF